ncbi:MAG: sugar ABC transporter permease [Anaerolineae bacterium]|nr:sugar ABC transporter permease [Anaerolineae bacterium]
MAQAVARRLVRSFSSQRVQEEIHSYLFIAPWLVGLVLFTLGPILAAFGLSFTRYDMARAPVFLGAANYARAFDDRAFQAALSNTAAYVLMYVPLELSLSLTIALAMNRPLRGITVFRTSFFIPVVTSGVATALLWGYILNQYGVLNYLLGLVGLGPVRWLGLDWALRSIVIMSLWGAVGYTMMYWLAGLQGVPQELYEAAEIDGGGRWARFRHVTLPMLTPMIFFLVIVSVIGSFQVFTPTYVLTQGGPANATLTIALAIYQKAFMEYAMGYACALAWLLFVVVFALTMVQWRVRRLWVFGED